MQSDLAFRTTDKNQLSSLASLTRPSRVAFTLRATLVDDKTRRVLAVRQFDATEPAPGEDAYGGVVAANRAVQKVLEDLALFCTQAATLLRGAK